MFLIKFFLEAMGFGLGFLGFVLVWFGFVLFVFLLADIFGENEIIKTVYPQSFKVDKYSLSCDS